MNVKPKEDKYKGVHTKTKHNTYTASIDHNGVQLHIGTYKTEADAANTYNSKFMELFGEYACLNVVQQKVHGLQLFHRVTSIMRIIVILQQLWHRSKEINKLLIHYSCVEINNSRMMERYAVVVRNLGTDTILATLAGV
jgi:hypothetical protein